MAINYQAPIEIRDFRNGDWFWIQKAIWKNKDLSSSDKVIYGTIAFFANQKQIAWPCIDIIASFGGISPRQAYRSVKKLEEMKYLKVIRGGGRGKPNRYQLLKIKDDIMSGFSKKGDKKRVTNNTSILYNKNNSNKNNKKKYIKKKYSSLKDITEKDLREISETYKVSLGFVKLQFEKLTNYCEAKGRRYKNYKSALRNFVLGDMQKTIERRASDKYRPVDARNVPGIQR